MTPQEFIAKWQRANLSERSACQQHFLDLCDVLDQRKPAAADPDGAWYTFERGVRKTTGEKGWADVWMRGHFGWEYKGKHKDLDAAYQQLLLYREDLENPPLLVVCDLDRFEIHTNFTGTAKQVHRFDLAGLADPDNLDLLRRLFTEPESLRPGLTTEGITRQAAEQFGLLADGMRVRGVEAHTAAHFLMKLMFCMFAEDIRLLPEKIFSRILTACKNDPQRLSRRLTALFRAMSAGGDFGADPILHFNGGLFADGDVVELRDREIEALIRVNDYDWGNVEPSIFGTLFERTLDPAKRSQIGAHYTSRADILTLLEPVVMAPLRRQWGEIRARCEKQWEKVRKTAREAKSRKTTRRRAKAPKVVQDFERMLLDFDEHLAHVRILDPACGSGNFLYVGINLLLDLEKEVIAYAAGHGVSMLPQVRPTQLAGIEINPYAQQLAQVVIWIGYLQWMHHNGFSPPRDPVLEPIESIRLQDAILDLSDPETPKEPQWPEADFIVGNPPFLGGKLLRTGLGDEYVDKVFRLWKGRVPHEADLCCYWFEKARAHIVGGSCNRAGLLATQGIRGGANRKVLARIKNTGDIFWAESDRPWILDGAAVHVSMVGFDAGTESHRVLDGTPVTQINPNLSADADTTAARPLAPNLNMCYMADTKGGAFDITDAYALQMLRNPNPHGKPNSDVVVPWANGLDVARRWRDMWIIDFGLGTPLDVAAQYELPFQHVEQKVRPLRANNKRKSYRERWWIHVEPRPAMRSVLHGLSRFLVTISLGKYRLFVWLLAPTLPDHQLFAFAQAEDSFAGTLNSRMHEVWALRMGTQLETRPRYTPTTCFETFPFPEPTDDQQGAIAAAAKELDALRNNWLNPPEWTRQEVLEFPGSVDGPWARYLHDPDDRGIGTVRYPRTVPRDEDCAAKLKKRTLTNLYNQRPTWLELAQRRLDEAVLAAYGWEPDLPDEEILAKLLELNRQRAGQQA
ncbi:MAG: class I SAM-dependent DNA methyltransferase [Pirellulales bacterium]|nr:class I SAM-dependent DNA methyltransferase [Pirellulales bacterium]